MSGAVVLDCSVAMAWCFPDESTPATNSLLKTLEHETAVVPGLWFLEVANVLSLAEKRKRLTPTKSAEFLKFLSAFELEVDHEAASRAFDYVLPLCRAHGLTAYDATYLELALRRRLPLATLDGDLRAGARALGVALLGR